MDFVKESPLSSMLSKNHRDRRRFWSGANLHRRLIVQNERNASGMSDSGRLAAITSTGVLEVFDVLLSPTSKAASFVHSLPESKHGPSLPKSTSSYCPEFTSGRLSDSERQKFLSFYPSRT